MSGESARPVAPRTEATRPSEPRASARGACAVPLAYLSTFRTYGSWLAGDPRGWVERRQNVPGTPYGAPDPARRERERRRLRQPPVSLDATAASVADRAIREAAERRGWLVFALNVRTNHVHSVGAAACRPEEILRTFKAWASAALHARGVVPAGSAVWARHGSTRYLWSQAAVDAACAYVFEGQGEDLARRDRTRVNAPAG